MIMEQIQRIPGKIIEIRKREKKRVVSLGFVFVGLTVKNDRTITISRDPQTNTYYVDVDGVNNYVGKTVPEWARLRLDEENTFMCAKEISRLGWYVFQGV